MKVLLLAVVTLVVLVPVASISCYTGASISGTVVNYFTQYSPCDICYTYTVSGTTTKGCEGSGTGSVTCSTFNTYNTYGSYSCCATNLCNGAKINGVSILMASVAAIVALFRSM